MFKRSLSPNLLNRSDKNTDISLTLGKNKLVMNEHGDWIHKSSDLDSATLEIEQLVDDKETLAISLAQCIDQVDQFKKEIIELNDMKAVILEMVQAQLMVERQKRIQLENELEGYKEELKESFKVIVELRKLIPQQE